MTAGGAQETKLGIVVAISGDDESGGGALLQVVGKLCTLCRTKGRQPLLWLVNDRCAVEYRHQNDGCCKHQQEMTSALAAWRAKHSLRPNETANLLLIDCGLNAADSLHPSLLPWISVFGRPKPKVISIHEVLGSWILNGRDDDSSVQLAFFKPVPEAGEDIDLVDEPWKATMAVLEHRMKHLDSMK